MLTKEERDGVNQQFQAEVSALREPFGNLTKADIRTAVDAVDDAFDALLASVPEPAASELTDAQRDRLLRIVTERRHAGAQAAYATQVAAAADAAKG